MPTYTKCLDLNRNELKVGDSVHHQAGYAVVVEVRGARAIIQFVDGSRLYSRGIDLVNMNS